MTPTGTLLVDIPSLPAGWRSRWRVRAGDVEGTPGRPMPVAAGPTTVRLEVVLGASRWWARAASTFDVDVVPDGQTTVRIPSLVALATARSGFGSRLVAPD